MPFKDIHDGQTHYLDEDGKLVGEIKKSSEPIDHEVHSHFKKLESERINSLIDRLTDLFKESYLSDGEYLALISYFKKRKKEIKCLHTKESFDDE